MRESNNLFLAKREESIDECGGGGDARRTYTY